MGGGFEEALGLYAPPNAKQTHRPHLLLGDAGGAGRRPAAPGW
jgi:hypothetical protein